MNRDVDMVYVLTSDGDSWEDIVIYTTEVDAIKASMKNPMCRVEIFAKKATEYAGGYVPTYNFYQQGTYISTNNK